MIMRKSLLLGTLALAAGAGTAQADPLLGLYAGVGAISGSVDNVFDSHQDISNKEWKAYAGLRPVGSPLGFEAEYLDFGSYHADFGGIGSADASAHLYAFDAVGYIPVGVPFLQLIAKAGLARWDVSGNVQFVGGGPFTSFGEEDHAYQFTWGAGAQANFGALGVRLEYEKFNVSGTDGAHAVTLGVSFTFL
jgi:hypothetical protein